jgi:hypothetical protein
VNRIDRIRAKVEKIEALCVEVKAELEELSRESEANQAKKSTKEESTLPTENECRKEFDRLYDEYLAGNPKAVEEFVAEKPKDYLKVFCKVNNLSVDTKKASKERVTSEILQWLAQRKAITGRVSSR